MRKAVAMGEKQQHCLRRGHKISVFQKKSPYLKML
jgi:hypothetical protein